MKVVRTLLYSSSMIVHVQYLHVDDLAIVHTILPGQSVVHPQPANMMKQPQVIKIYPGGTQVVQNGESESICTILAHLESQFFIFLLY